MPATVQRWRGRMMIGPGSNEGSSTAVIDPVLIPMDPLVQTRRGTYRNRPKECRSRRNGDAAKPAGRSHVTADSLTIYCLAQPVFLHAGRRSE